MRIALLINDKTSARRVSNLLKIHGHHYRIYENEWQANIVFCHHTFDLIVVELDGTNDSFCLKRKRPWQRQKTPVIALLRESSNQSFEISADAGAQDFILLPSDDDTISLRIAVALARAYPNRLGDAFSIGPYFVIPDVESILLEGRILNLSPSQFRVALCLMQNPGRPLSRDYIFEFSRDEPMEGTSRVIDTEIGTLRHKLRLDQTGCTIGSLHSFGYRLNVPDYSQDSPAATGANKPPFVKQKHRL